MQLDGSLVSNVDRIAAGHIKQLLIKVLTPIIKSTTNPPDYVEDYRAEYGVLGPALHAAVVKARTQPTPATTVSSGVPSSSIASVNATITRTAPTGIIQVSKLLGFSVIVQYNLDDLTHTGPDNRRIIKTFRVVKSKKARFFVFYTGCL